MAFKATPGSNKDAQFDGGSQEAPASKQARPVMSAEPQSTNELRVVPICSCPRKHPPKAEKSVNPKTAPQAERPDSASKRKKPQSLANVPRSSTADITATPDATVKADDCAQESVAKQCTTCKKFKAPPSGKKITYRKARGKYMCVPRNAHDEVGPVDTVMRRTMSEVDAPTRQTSEPDLTLADGMEEDSAALAASSNTSTEQGISQSETSQSVSEERTVESPTSPTPVLAKILGTQEDETSLDEHSITSTDSIAVAWPEVKNQPTSNKRPAEPSNEQPPAKHPRIEDSITTDNEIRAVSIKTDPEADPDVQFVASRETTKTGREKRLEEDIARKQRELREIRLEKEIEELQHQLAEEQRRKQNATPVVTVKQEVIELD